MEIYRSLSALKTDDKVEGNVGCSIYARKIFYVGQLVSRVKILQANPNFNKPKLKASLNQINENFCGRKRTRQSDMQMNSATGISNQSHSIGKFKVSKSGKKYEKPLLFLCIL
uniref:Uncharacterized protein n=1 Tax=Romanomermis culicivorax TaxID=13658 RepID=A0A915IUL1_ROMCU